MEQIRQFNKDRKGTAGIVVTLVALTLLAFGFGPLSSAATALTAISAPSPQTEAPELALNPDLIFDWGRGDGDCRPGVCRS